MPTTLVENPSITTVGHPHLWISNHGLKIHLSLEQHWFELCECTYMWNPSTVLKKLGDKCLH